MSSSLRLFLASLIFFFVFSPQSIASIVTIAQEPPIDESGIFGRLQFDWERKTGNATKLAYGGALNAGYSFGKSQILVLAKEEREHALGVLTDESALRHLRYRYLFDELLAFETFAQQAEDPFARLQSRRLLGAGLRFHFKLLEDTLDSFLGLGAMAEDEEIDPLMGEGEDLVTENYANRLASYLVFTYAPTEKLRLEQTIYFQPSFSDGNDFRLLSQSALLINIVSKLSLRMAYEVNRDTRPPVGVLETDTVFKNGLVWELH